MINYVKQDAEVRRALVEELKALFPIEGKTHVINIKNVDVRQKHGPNDISAQKDAKLKGRTFSADIYADLVLKDKKTGKKIDAKTMKLMDIPQVTERGTYLIKGTEYNVPYQLRIKPGVYSRVQDDGNLVSLVNLSKGTNFKVSLSDEDGKFYIQHGNMNIPLYPILMALGKTRQEVQRQWGTELTDINSSVNHESAVKKLHGNMGFDPTRDVTEMHTAIEQKFSETKMENGTTKSTLGKEFTKVDGNMLLATASNLLKIKRGQEKPTGRDAIQYKSVHGMEDFIRERVRKQSWKIKNKVLNRLDNKEKLKEIVSPDVFNKPINSFFYDGTVAIANTPKQANPVDIFTKSDEITLSGAGGITNPETVTDEARSVHPSSIGLIDPVFTPECFSEDTEVLTSLGWKPWPDVDRDDLFACNIDGRLEFHKAEKLHCGDYSGPMFRGSSSVLDYLVTPNHRMWCRPVDEGCKYRFVNAEDMPGYKRKVMSSHESYAGFYRKYIDLPSEESPSNAAKTVSRVASDDWAELIGWFVSEDNCQYDEDKSRYCVKITQSKDANIENCQRIEALLDRLPFAWSLSSDNYVLATKQIASYFAKMGGCSEKYIPEDVFGLHVSARERCFEAMMLGDGKNLGRPGASYATTSERLARDFERLATSLGYPSTITKSIDNRKESYKDVYYVNLHIRREKEINHYSGHYSVEDYDGSVYCATVPGGLLYTRRMGKVGFWSGNSGKIGMTLHMPLEAVKDGNDLKTKVIDIKTGKEVTVDSKKLEESTVSFGDEYELKNGKWKPKKKMVRAYSSDGKMKLVDSKTVDYLFRDGKSLFSFATNLIPFLSSTHPNRSMFGSKMIAQALPLANPEAPMVRPTLRGRSLHEVMGRGITTAANIDGKVTSVKDGIINVKGRSGKIEPHPYYHNFPLNEGHFAHDKVLVKAGDSVKKGQRLTENMFTDNGVLSYGTNLRVGYMAPKGLTFEDAVAISESASKRLTSQHMYKISIEKDSSTMLGLKKFRLYAPTDLSAANSVKLDDDGVIKKGQTVEPGDHIFAGLRTTKKTPDEEIIGRFNKKIKPYRKYTKTWEKDFVGEVTDVVKGTSEITIYIKTQEQAQPGDKVAGTSGNKGVISEVLPDHMMPQDSQGRPMDILMNPLGIPSRINPSQLLETAAGKIAEASGKPYEVENFSGEDQLDKVKKDMASAGVSDKEELTDPQTGKSLGKIMTGKQYVMKLDHNVSKKLSARGPLGESTYTSDMTPTAGKQQGGLSMDALTTYAMLSHGAKENLKEMATDKAEKNDEFWMSLEKGSPLPQQKPTFAWNKFINTLKASGIDVREEGNKFQMLPLTDAQIKKMSNGEVKKEDMLRSKNLVPMKGGLFDKDITGGASGTNWSHISLAEPMLNPVFIKPVMSLLDLTSTDVDNIVSGKLYIDKEGKKVSKDAPSAKTGSDALRVALKAINIDKTISEARERAKNVTGTNLDKANRKIRYLTNLKKMGEDASVYITKSVPVLPPIFRPIYPLPDGNLRVSDVNVPYKDLLTLSNQVKDAKSAGLPDDQLQDARREMFDAYKALVGIASPVTRKEFKGTLESVAGGRPKSGFYQSKIISRRQELSGRSTVIPNPGLAMDQVEIPKEIAWTLYRPFMKKRLHAQGYPLLRAAEEIDNKSNVAQKALDLEMANRPILMNRAPTLHKFGILAFTPKVSSKKAIGVNPFIVKGYNMDFDGDTVQLHVPIREKARKEAYKMFPSANLFSPMNNAIIHKPSMETIVGLNLLTREGKKTNKKYTSEKQAIDAYKDKFISMNDSVIVGNKRTTVGRILINSQMPEGAKVDTEITKKVMDEILTGIAHKSPQKYAKSVETLRDLGNDAAFTQGFTVGLSDIDFDTKKKDAMFDAAEKKLKPNMSDDSFVKIYESVLKKLDGMIDNVQSDNAFKIMMDSGSKGDAKQIRQVMAAPTLVQDLNEKPVLMPIRNSYAQGLSTGEYFASQEGARRSMMDRALQTKWPGVINKELVNATASQAISAIDCGTRNGKNIPVGNDNILNRLVARDDSGILRYNQIIDSNNRAKLISKKVKSVKVRSPLTCEAQQGMCAKCFGLNEYGELPNVGDNVGVKAAQTISEPNTQMTMRTFHTGGAVGNEQTFSQGFWRTKDILQLRTNLPGKAVLSRSDGDVDTVSESPTGGYYVTIDEERHTIPSGYNLKVKEGQKVKSGDALTSGPIKPQELAEYKGLEAAQDYIVDELDKTYRDGGLKIDRRMFEVVARPMTSTVRVSDPGDSDMAPGDYASSQKVNAWNKSLKNPIKSEPILTGINTVPLYSEDWLARLNTTRLKDTMTEGAAKGFVSEISSITSPIASHAFGFERGKVATA